MGRFKKAFKKVAKVVPTAVVAKAVKKPVTSAVKSTIKNAVPLTAAYFTGGASLALMKPSGGMFDSVFGSPEAQEAMGSLKDVAVDYAQEKAQAEANRFIDKKFNPKKTSPTSLTSKRINSQSVSVGSKPITESISQTFSETVKAVGGKSKLFMILGGGVVLIIAIFLIKGGKK